VASRRLHLPSHTARSRSEDWALLIFSFGVARLALTALLGALACRPAASAGVGAAVVDDAGDTVRVGTVPRRIVSLIPATTELLFAIGAGPAVVGRTEWCDFPAAAAKVPNLGDGINPNVEAVLASRPDLVILYNSAQNAAIAGRLRHLGIPTLRLNTDALTDVDRVGRLLGRVTGHQAGADSVASAFDTALARATMTPAGKRPTVLLLVWEQPPMTIGRGSFLSELVERAGGANLFEDVSATAGTISIEAVAARDPDFILTTSAGPAAFARRPEWQAVRAVRERRFLPVTSSEFNRPSPRAPAGIRELARKLREAT
jgi:ABC-type Fe3+-hydroxamate transport system substrate-binding protein